MKTPFIQGADKSTNQRAEAHRGHDTDPEMKTEGTDWGDTAEDNQDNRNTKQEINNYQNKTGRDND